MSAKLKKAKILYSLAEASIYSYNRWLGNHSLIATYYVNQLFLSFYTCIKISMTLEAYRIHACTTASTL
jgi:hypothetical protein